MQPLILVFLSGITGALYGLAYKVRSRRNYSVYGMLFLFSLSSALFSLLFLALFHEPLFSLKALFLGIPYGVCMVISLSLYFSVVSGRARLNISWIVIQFSVLLPFLMSILWYGERLHFIALIGILCIFLSLFFFGLGKRGAGGSSAARAIPDLKTGLMLLLSFLFTGLSLCIPKIYIVVEPGGGSFTLMLYRGLSMIPGSLLLLLMDVNDKAAKKEAVKRHTWKPGLFLLSSYMSLNGVLMGAFIILALRGIDGSAAFPLRAIVNVLFVFLLSFVLFRERVSPLEGIGALVALTGIALVTFTMS